MKKITFPIVLLLAVALSAFTAVHSVNWSIAEGYSVKFTSKNPSGVFTKMTGDISFDENSLETSKVNITIDVASINTGNGMKNRHARSEKWFDEKDFPTIQFTSGKVSKSANGYEVTGTLNMHGVQKEVSIPFTFANNAFTSSFSINRLDYKIGTTEGMSAKAATDLKIDIFIPVTKK